MSLSSKLESLRECLVCHDEKTLGLNFPITHGGRSRTCITCLEQCLGFNPTQYKRCSSCKKVAKKTSDVFPPHPRGGLRSECRACHSTRNVARKKKLSPERRWKYNLTRWHISSEDYFQMLEEQNGVCAVCHSNGRLYIDHDHSCCPGNHSCGKCIRGLLCIRCNSGEGFVRDQDWLRSMLEYTTERAVKAIK